MHALLPGRNSLRLPASVSETTIVAVTLLSCVLTGCITTQEIVDYQRPKSSVLCVAVNDSIKNDVLDEIVSHLAERGYRHMVVPARYVMSEGHWRARISKKDRGLCGSIVRYVAKWGRDIFPYMYFATIWIADAETGESYGLARYDASRNSGFGKFINSRAKIRELMSELFP